MTCFNWRYAFLLSQLTGTTLHAQVTARTRVNNVAINGAIGAVTGAVWAKIRHSRIWDGAKQGLVGGAFMSAGRQTAASPFGGSGFIGREVSAVGISLITSAGERSTTFMFPVGPVTFEYGEHEYNWRVNVTDFAIAVGVAVSPHARLDLHQSLSAGVLVFKLDRVDFGHEGDWDLTGETLAGTILLSRSAFDPRTGKANVAYHERVHVLQDDYFEDAIALPPERAVIRPLPLGRRFLKHLDLGLLGQALEGGMSHLIPYDSMPWEREAYGLTANLKY